MTKIKEIIDFLEKYAPKDLQESYDNSGLLLGDPENIIEGILVTLDCTEEVVKEAIEKKCNLVLCHHPILFKPLKSLTGKNYIERTLILAIKHGVSIYAIHTNLDNIKEGVNAKISEKLGLKNLKVLLPKRNALNKLTTFVPEKDASKVLDALYKAGAGNIGNYSNCSFRVTGTGTFMPNEIANPHIGEKNKLEEAKEERIEVIFPTYLTYQVMNALNNAHPYEEVAYYLHNLENFNDFIGSGMIGELENPMDVEDFLNKVKGVFNLKVVRYTESDKSSVSRIAVCGGSGSFLLSEAKRQKADVFVTADFKYHEFFDAENNIVIADIGHYESEFFTKELIYETVKKKFTNIALEISEINTNPVRYL